MMYGVRRTTQPVWWAVSATVGHTAFLFRDDMGAGELAIRGSFTAAGQPKATCEGHLGTPSQSTRKASGDEKLRKNVVM